jgi:hypothetical protein
MRMWLYGLSFTVLWGTLAMKAWRVNALVMNEAESAAGMKQLGDGKLMACALLSLNTATRRTVLRAL